MNSRVLAERRLMKDQNKGVNLKRFTFWGRLFIGLLTLTLPALGLSEGLAFRSCDLAVPNTDIVRKAECADLELPLFQSSDDTIKVGVVRFKARSKNSEADPLLMLAGGPGQAASEAYIFADRQFNKLAFNRDIYLIDQRGTGRSTKFQCDALSSLMFDDHSSLGSEAIEQKTLELSQQCLDNFAFDPRYFTTSPAIADFEAVRSALGIKKWNLFAVSYGTRVALHYLRKYPSSIRSLVLDSVVYPEHALGSEVAIQSQNALDRMIARCQNDPACSEAFPNLQLGINQLLEGLEKAAVDLRYDDLTTGASVDTSFTSAHLMLVLRMSLYQDESVAILPVRLREAYKNHNYIPLSRAADLYAQKLQGLMAIGMHNTVTCTEDFPFFSGQQNSSARDTETYMGDAFIEQLQDICKIWPRGIIDDDFKEPLYSELPILLFSGEDDPITPPVYAERAQAHLGNSKHVVANGQGHNVTGLGCAPSLIAKFVDELNLVELDTSCMSRVVAAPFFIDFNGPNP